MGRAAEGRFQEGWPEQFRIPGNAPVKFIGLAEADCRADIRSGGEEEVQDTVSVVAGEAASENLNVHRAAAFALGIFERVI